MLPALFYERMNRLLGAEAERFYASYSAPRHGALRFNPGKCEDLTALPFCREPVAWAKHGYYFDPQSRPGLHPYHDAGLYYLQEASAMAPASLLDAQPGERVLDLCAAPGGKSTQLAAAMEGQGLLVCNEIHPKRAQILSGNIERMGIANALVVSATPAQLSQRFPGWFDRVQVDAPCSGEGMFRREPAAIADWSEETVQMCAQRQKGILADASRMVRPGGHLVYSTCTFAPEENEGVIADFLRTHPDFTLEEVEAPWFASGRPEWVDGPEELHRCVRLWPHLLHGEGHFAARLRRLDGEEQEPESCRGSKLPKEFIDFSKEHALSLPMEEAVQFGETLYLAPPQTPALSGLRVLRAGLELGQVRKGRFTPAHALALWLKSAPSEVDYPSDSPEIMRYLRGETLPTEKNGWTLVKTDGYSIGWGKGAAGILKNHYPKGLRRLG